jgi:hypothetical protein
MVHSHLLHASQHNTNSSPSHITSIHIHDLLSVSTL